METLLQNVRFAFRTLRKRPGFTLVAIATLALGIGANTALFSVVQSVLLRPLPYSEPDRVVALWSSWVGWEKTWLSEPEVLDYRDGATSLDAVGAYSIGSGNLTGDGPPERVATASVSSGVFSALGPTPLLGRTFTAEEDTPGGGNIALISEGLWQRRFASDPGVIGQTIYYDGEPRTIIGVLPADFRLPEDYEVPNPAELWIPLGIDEADPGSRGSHYLLGVAHLADGFTVAQAQAELDRITAGWVDADLVPAEAEFRAVLVPAQEEVLGPVRTTLLLLFGAVGLVLMIACANVANLLIATSDSRRREIAIRSAIGAGRRRIISQLMTESVVLSIAGGVCGVVLAAVGTSVLTRLQPANIPRLTDVQVDASVLGFALLVTLLSGVFFGIGPSLIFSRLSLSSGLRDGGRTGSAGPARNFFRRSMIVAEVALSMVLVIGAGLMVRSVVELYGIDLGFQPEHVLTMRMSLPASDYPEAADVTRFVSQLEERVAALPGALEVGATRLLPLTGTIGDWGILPEGRTNPEDAGQADWQVVTPGYVEAMGIELIRGRTITDADRLDAPPVAMINETMAARFWADEDPIGRRFQMGGPDGPLFTVVGILGGVKHNDVTEEPRTEMYIPHEQFQLVNGTAPRGMTLVVSTAGNPLELASAVRQEIASIDPNLPIADIQSLGDIASRALSQPRFAMLLLAGLALLALTLAAIGIYGVISYSVAERRHEMGIRMALGAESRRLLVMVIGEGMKLTLVGVGVGLVAALLLTRLMAGILYSVGTLDPLTFVVVPALLTAVALAASWIPSRRAARVDPIVSLRAD